LTEAKIRDFIKKGKRKMRLLIIFFLLFSKTIFAKQCLTEEDVKRIVIQVIKENPKLLYDVLNSYLKELREKKELSLSLKRRISVPILKHNPTKGPKDAPITIIEFTDFQCIFCKKGKMTMDELMMIYPNKIRLVYKNLPLSKIHKEALSAAKAAMAANKQGMFWPYYDMLFDSSPNLGNDVYLKIAKMLNLDISRFKSDMNSEEIKKQIQMDIEEARRFGINATPTFVINGVVIRGAKSLSFFKKVIDRLLKEKEN